MTVQSVFINLIAQADANNDTAGATALRTAWEQLPRYADWTLRSDGTAPSDQVIDVVMQRHAPSQPGDVEQIIERDVRVNYPNNNVNSPVYVDAFGNAIEVDGWYVTHHSFPLPKPDPIPHSEP